MKENGIRRRQFLKLGGVTLALIPVLVVSSRTEAATNAALRSSLKYQGTPQGDKSCSKCAHFIPGPTAKDPGGCKVMPGDTEISPNGYCTAWIKKA